MSTMFYDFMPLYFFGLFTRAERLGQTLPFRYF